MNAGGRGVVLSCMKCLSFAWILLAAFPVMAQPNPADAFEQNRKLGRGVNIIGYDPLWRSREQGRFQAKHFRLLKEAGFNSVRVNLHAFRHMDRNADWALRTAWWETLDWAVTNATSQGLMVILDLHEFNAIGEDPEGHKDRFLAFWRQVSARFQSAPNSVVFEILNEPCKKLTPPLWNVWLREALALIREKNPTRTVIAGPAFWNSVDHLNELELPAADRNLIATVHYYKPMAFTHQGATWSSEEVKPLRGVPYPSTPEAVAPVLDTASIGEMIDALRAAAEVPGVKNDAFGAFFAFSPPELSREDDIIAYINDISNAIVGSEIYTFLRFGCVLPGADHAAVESSTGEVPCFSYHKSRLVHDESVSHRSVKDRERVGDFALTWPDTVFHVFMIGLLENLEKWSFRKYDARDYFAGL